MNRSHRRTLAISWSVAVGVAFAGMGMMNTAQAAAGPDPDMPAAEDRGARSGQGGTGQERKATADSARRGRLVSVPAGDPGGRGRTPDDAGWWDCHRWPHWQPVFPAVNVEPNRNGFILIGAFAGIGAPPSFAGPAVLAAADRTPAGYAGAAPAAVAEQSAAAPSVAASMRAPLGGPLPPAPPPAPSPASSSPAPVPAVVTSKSVGAPPVAARIGYPDYLRSASPAQVAALALTGAAALAALTGAGGFVGYRQAKAGFALRAAGTARFLS